ncbi:hypothetical protein GCM10023177_10880 [Streptomyces violaceoruber]|nr:hypothetical protein JCM4020_74970 [Streptomyces coelicolor]
MQVHHGSLRAVGPCPGRGAGLHGDQHAQPGPPVVGQHVVVDVDPLPAGLVPQQPVRHRPAGVEGEPRVLGEVPLLVRQVGFDGVLVGLGAADLDPVYLVEEGGDGGGVGEGGRSQVGGGHEERSRAGRRVTATDCPPEATE